MNIEIEEIIGEDGCNLTTFKGSFGKFIAISDRYPCGISVSTREIGEAAMIGYCLNLSALDVRGF